MKDFHKDYHRNSVILDSLPVRHSVVRYFETKFRIIAQTRGYEAASDSFKSVRELILSYISDESRLSNREEYYTRYPFRKNGWMKALFDIADVQPHAVLDLLKLYTSFKKPLVSVEEAQEAMTEYLGSRASEREKGLRHMDLFLDNWLANFVLARKLHTIRTKMIENGVDDYSNDTVYTVNVAFGKSNTMYLTGDELIEYFLPYIHAFERKNVSSEILEPDPLMYKDMVGSKLSSDTYQEDSDAFYELVESSYLDEEGEYGSRLVHLQDLLVKHVLPSLPDPGFDPPMWSDMNGFAGRVHHIPKKGTVKRRSIAVPNRFFQAGLLPLQRGLYQRLRSFPRDCTFNQSRFVGEIKSRVDRGLFVQGIDLSQATDNLPYDWFQKIQSVIAWSQPETWSKDIFDTLLKMPWMNGDNNEVYWTVGQPLGSLPSFGILAMTHNIMLEAISFTLGRIDRPFVVLGDDLLVFDKRIAQQYICTMQGENIPLSLHKSYKGRLVEFAGRFFIRNQVPYYSSDHAAVTFTSLFDYQRSTGIRIPWNNLPSKIRSRISRACGVFSAEKVYTILSYANTLHNLPQNESFERDLVSLLTALELSERPPEADRRSDITFFTKEEWWGTMLMHRETPRKTDGTGNDWFRTKVRPYTTEFLIETVKKCCTGISA